MERSRMLRLVGAVLVLIGGAIHLALSFDDDYGRPENIVRSFAINAGVSALVAAYLVLRDDILGPLAGIAVSVGTLVGFTLTRVGDGFLDFRETGFDAPYATLTVGIEVAAILVLMGAIVTMQTQRATSSPQS